MLLPGPHHVSEVGTKGACGLVVLHDAAVVQDLAAIITANQTEDAWARKKLEPGNNEGR